MYVSNDSTPLANIKPSQPGGTYILVSAAFRQFLAHELAGPLASLVALAAAGGRYPGDYERHFSFVGVRMIGSAFEMDGFLCLEGVECNGDSLLESSQEPRRGHVFGRVSTPPAVPGGDFFYRSFWGRK